MICLDNDAFIAAHQQNPPPSSAAHTARVRAFIGSAGERVMVPAVGLSEYLFGFTEADRLSEVQAVLRRQYFIPPFDQSTAEIAAQLGRQFVSGRSIGEVARAFGSDRVRLKADLLVVSTAVQHSPNHFVSNDELTLALARFAGLNAHRLSDLPDPAPLPPPVPPHAPTKSDKPPNLFEDDD